MLQMYKNLTGNRLNTHISSYPVYVHISGCLLYAASKLLNGVIKYEHQKKNSYFAQFSKVYFTVMVVRLKLLFSVDLFDQAKTGLIELEVMLLFDTKS